MRGWNLLIICMCFFALSFLILTSHPRKNHPSKCSPEWNITLKIKWNELVQTQRVHSESCVCKINVFPFAHTPSIGIIFKIFQISIKSWWCGLKVDFKVFLIIKICLRGVEKDFGQHFWLLWVGCYAQKWLIAVTLNLYVHFS